MTDNLHHYIRSNFGQDALKLVQNLEKTVRKVANYRNHLRFTIRCYHNNLTPKSLHLSSPIKGYKASRILHRAEKYLINERIRQINSTLRFLNEKVIDIKEELFTTLPSEAYDRIIDFTSHAQLSQREIGKKCQLEKF